MENILYVFETKNIFWKKETLTQPIPLYKIETLCITYGIIVEFKKVINYGAYCHSYDGSKLNLPFSILT